MAKTGRPGAGKAPGGFSLWGGRFGGASGGSGLSPEADALNRSLPVDGRLWPEELEVEAAWALALAGAGVLPAEEATAIERGLERVGARLSAGAAEGAADEDVHTLVERLLGEEVGEVARKLRTGQSRNDRAATAVRLWTMRAVSAVDAEVARLQAALLTQAEAGVDVLMPAYTHLQRAQPVRMAHWWLSHLWPLARDRDRLAESARRASALPLGAGAVAGSGFPVDREALRRRLGFERLTRNSIDAVSDRDYVADAILAAALLGVHLSRLAEDLIVFSSAEFAFVSFDDAYSTGSSLLPQKRNPDVAELARGKSARLAGNAAAVLALLKGLPTGYNKDLQEDKAILFDSVDTLRLVLPALAGAVATARVHADACARALDPSMLATDVADALVQAGLSFGDAHEVVGRLVRAAEEAGVGLFQVPQDGVVAIHPALPPALATIAGAGGPGDFEASVERRSVAGGTARAAVLQQIAETRKAIGEEPGASERA